MRLSIGKTSFTKLNAVIVSVKFIELLKSSSQVRIWVQECNNSIELSNVDYSILILIKNGKVNNAFTLDISRVTSTLFVKKALDISISICSVVRNIDNWIRIVVAELACSNFTI